MIKVLSEKANKLPLLPGVYIMKDARGEVIYVGKAKKLKNRVSSYFHGEHLPKVEAMVQKVADFDVIVANSEFEALMLENSLIKRHMPHYNILLRDDKGYPFVRLDDRKSYPTFSIVGRTAEDGAKYFGPYGSRGTTKEIVETMCKALKLPTCNRKFPRDIGKERPCLNYHMGQCAGYCLKDTPPDEYMIAIRQAELLLSGKTSELTKQLSEKMMKASDELKFELAAEYRDRLRAIESLSNKQKVIATTFADTDAIGFFRGGKTCFTVMHYSDGNLAGKDFELMEEPVEEDAEAIEKLVSQYYSVRGTWPKNVLLPMETENIPELEQMLTELAGHRVYITVPKRGDKAGLTATACMNAREEVLRAMTVQQRRNKTLEALQNALGLNELPSRIESFDISNMGNFGIVAGMVVFVAGKPLKRDYRRFRITSTNGQDDYGSMYEAVSRRFKRCIDGDEKFAEVPNLLLIDGGSVHAGVAEAALNELGLVLPVVGMVKDDHHRTRALVTPDGDEIGIVSNQALFSFIGTIQEETHRYAIEYNRKLRGETMKSELDNISGVGPKRRTELMKYFKSIKAIKSASASELAAVVPKPTAEAIYDYFHMKEL